MKDRFIVALALGLGLGRLPKAPGTFGTLLGFPYLFVLLLLPSLTWLLLVASVALLAGVWICAEAERILQQHDPGCVVIDEILAIPFAGLGWMAWRGFFGASWLPPVSELSWTDGVWWLVIFGVFRVFDIGKPWPVGVSQNLPGGWGVMADDLLAACYTAAVTFAARWLVNLVFAV